jgi:ATP-binding cassette subfamily B protein
MKNFKMLWKYMKGNRLLYIGAVISIGFAAFFSTVIPLVIRTTIDSIIGDKPMSLPDLGIKFIKFLGGKSYLVQNIWICAILLVILTLFRGVFLFLKGKWSAVASENIARNMREKLYDHIQHLPYDYYVKSEAGDLIQRCTSDVDTVRRFLAMQFVEIGRAICIICFAAVIMFSMSFKMSVVAVACIPAIFIFSIVFFTKIKTLFQKADEAEAKMTTVLQENLSGVRVVRAFGRQRYEIDKFEKVNTTFKDLSYKLYLLRSMYWSVSDFLCMLQTGAVLVAGIYFTVKGEITLGTLVVFMTYEGMLLWPVRQLGRILSDMGKMVVSLKRIEEILNLDIEEEKEYELRPEIQGNISFKDVYFEYEKDNPIIDGISFDVKKGQTIAIMGHTGCGKSSLIHLLARLYDYQRGSIKIDGFELKDINKKWIRKNVGIVLQEPFLFSKTIKENIGIAKRKMIQDEIFEAASIAAVHDVILGFDKGYETVVGEKGVTLSGGQRQRIAIARTLINNTPILIFDDSLSAVDTETDIAIRKALSSRSKDITTFIISHRISTLREADRIIVLDKGKIVQSGTHNELVKQEGLYKRVWDIQSSITDEFKEKSKVS